MTFLAILTLVIQLLIAIIIIFTDEDYSPTQLLFKISICIFAMVNTLNIKFNIENLNTLLTVNSIFLAISLYLDDSKLIKISVLNFILVLDNYFFVLLPLVQDPIVLFFKSLFTFFITVSMLLFLNELLKK
nr:MAG TPA: hypothetical protein [Caudoviricetes sp.]DAY35586.1 MAG TPA: hypothetical protein [Caudoviricetes sp.]